MEIDTSDLSWFKTELSAYVLAQLNSTVNPESRFLTRRKLLNEVVTGNQRGSRENLMCSEELLDWSLKYTRLINPDKESVS